MTLLALALNELTERRDYKQAVYRIVETQEYAATTSLVDDLDEQSVLELLLDDVKPPYRENTQSRHYLISTPFRYPPLRYGSRFGDITMPSYFYASEDTITGLAECAFYRFAFLSDISVPYDKAITSEHMSFSVDISASAMSDLTSIKNDEVSAQLRSKSSYQLTQQIGKALIESGTTVIRFLSARADDGVNVALARPDEITSVIPNNNINWLCHTTNDKVSFVAPGQQGVTFNKSQFLVDGVLPRLA